jgi:hypothetical protein
VWWPWLGGQGITIMLELLIAVLGLSSAGIFAAHTIDALRG